jgi:hypothetical protein
MGCTMTAWLNTRVVCSSSGTTWNHRHVKAPSPFGVKYLRAGGRPTQSGGARAWSLQKTSRRVHNQAERSMIGYMICMLAVECSSPKPQHRRIEAPHSAWWRSARVKTRPSNTLAALGSRLSAAHILCFIRCMLD